MLDRDPIFFPPSILEQVEMLKGSIMEYKTAPKPTDINDDLDAAGFLTEECHAQATGLHILSRYLRSEATHLLAHLNSLKY
ncbi:MAG: hypothetical protein UY21_C0032G0006 [Microgenomates group bacterium GW2011_GWA1_48_10]|nr:MAG: hypothetical protein UY21_C0032G0006 [Microgenomates group bacterium GW2011_GWA1_48_10]